MFHFKNTFGRKVWIRLEFVTCLYENEEGVYILGCVDSCWTLDEKTAKRLVEAMEARQKRLERLMRSQEDDWWKNGDANPLDSE